ncbi:unnamed protein product [Pieris macdunnoughi]|uniref:Major facilitator superfamily (MFS) profile domain-containing protein n=1 Tax=Pieris macdunnoughi TaxID=345717 RepID=A0A821LC68_9NEOP|nr:unnamed protein product [Pieris macdunnoughi]
MSNKEISLHNKDSVNYEAELKKVDYDELLSSAGQFGRFQILLFLAMFPAHIYSSFSYFSQLFMTEVSPSHWCWIPELENLTVIERRNLAIPVDANSQYGYSRCQSYIANWSEVLSSGLKPNTTWQIQSCQHGWEFDKTEIPYPTISSELGWVCEKDSYQATAQAVFFVGSTVGGFLIGWISDKYGRIPALVTSNLIIFIGGILSVFATDLLQFSACRFLVGMGYDNCVMMMYLLLVEYVAPKYRTIVANLPGAIFYTIGVTALPWICLACGHWKTISITTSVPMLLVILAPFVLPESPRWLLSKGRVNDTIDKIKDIGKVNGKEVPQQIIDNFIKTNENKEIQEKYSCMIILKHKVLRKSFICMCSLFMLCMIIFDALIRTIGALKYDFFLSFTFVSFTEFPSLLIISFILDLTGRKWLTIVALILTCVLSVLSTFVGEGLPPVMCIVLARFCVNFAINASMQWTTEILPTPVRGSGSSIVHICSYVSSVISPYIVYLQNYVIWLPHIIIGGIALLGAICAFMLPETANKEMPHTLKDAEDLVNNQILFDIPFLRKEKVEKEGKTNPSFDMK